VKRNAAIRKFLSLLEDNDVAIFTGKDMCEEAFKYDREGNFYLTEAIDTTASLALGMAMVIDKRIFVFCEDWQFLREFSASAQMAVSRCTNIIYVIFNSGEYQYVNNMPTIFNEFVAPRVFLSDLGFLVNDFTNYFKNKDGLGTLPEYIKRVKGPLAAIIKIQKGARKDARKEISYSKQELTNRIIKFVGDGGLGTSLYTNPSNLFLNMEE
jgi:hypothetical protein